MKRLNYLLITLLSSFLFFSCSPDCGETPTPPKTQDDRVFVLNEGQFGKSFGQLDIIDAQGNYTSKVDKGTLGGSAQGLSFFGDSTYIISQDSQEGAQEGKGRLVSLKTKDFSVVQDYSALIKTLEKPTKIAIIDLQNLFIRDGKAIHRLDLPKGQLTKVEGTDGATNTEMVVAGNLLIAAKGNSLIAIKKGENKVAKSLELNGTIKGLAKVKDNQIYVSTAGSDKATIYCINPQTLTINKQNEITGEAGTVLSKNYWGSASIIAAKGDNIYFAGGGSKIFRHQFSKGETKEMVDVKADGFYPTGEMTYNSVGVHPTTGHVYITRIKSWGEFNVNAIIELDLSGNTAKLIKLYENKVIFPANFYFLN